MSVSGLEQTRGLVRRLSEAEATIKALLSGEIDAVVDIETHSPVLLYKAQEALRDSEARFRAVAELAHDAIVSATTRRFVTFWNQSAEKMFGYSAGEMLGQSPRILLGERFAYVAQRELFDRDGPDGLPVNTGRVIELDARHKSGREFPIEVALSSWTTNGEHVFMCVIRDISERRRVQAEVVSHLQVDRLTGLLVRSVGEERIAAEVERARRHRRPLAIGLFDIDHFKQVNDAHGHAHGDLVLARIGAMVATVVRTSDVAVRWGGEEILIAMPETTLDGALECGERLRRGIKKLALASVGTVTISGGVAAHALDESLLETIARADSKLYDAKHHGRDRVVA